MLKRRSTLPDALRPSQRGVEELAKAEADPDQCSRFEPICKGPVFAVIVIVFAGLVSLPALLVRAVPRRLRGEVRGSSE
jgi:hypothetical protein